MLLCFMLAAIVLAGPPATRPEQGVRRGQDGSFEVLLSSTEDKAFFDNWEKPDTPRLSLPARVKRGETLYAVAIFSGAGADTNGNGKIQMKFKVLRPDGTVFGDGEFTAWDSAVKPTPLLELVKSYPAVDIALSDPIGTYKLQVTLTDQIAGKSVPLELPFEVVEK